MIIFCFLSFLYVGARVIYYDHQNPLITACLILATFLGSSAAQPIAAEDLIKQQLFAIPEAVCQPDPTTVQQQFKEGASTSGSKNPKKLGKRGISESTAEHGTVCDHKLCWFVSGTIIIVQYRSMEEKSDYFSLPLFINVLVLICIGHNFTYAT